MHGLSFFKDLRHVSVKDRVFEEFKAKAEFETFSDGSKKWIIVDDDTATYIDFNTYLSNKSGEAAKDLLATIETEMDNGAFDEKKKSKLSNYISEMAALADKLQQYYHLQKYPFLSDHLLKVITNLRVHYLPDEKKPAEEANAPGFSMKLKWVGPVTSLATLFYDLQTVRFSEYPTPFLKATKAEITTFIYDHFVDENDQPFSKSTIATYLDPHKPDKKSMKNRVPLNKILGKNKNQL